MRFTLQGGVVFGGAGIFFGTGRVGRGGISGSTGDKPPAWPPGVKPGGRGKPSVELDGGMSAAWPAGVESDGSGKPPVEYGDMPPGVEIGGGGKASVELDDGGLVVASWRRGVPPLWPRGDGGKPPFGCQRLPAFGATLLSLVYSAPTTLNISGMSNESKSKPMSNAA